MKFKQTVLLGAAMAGLLASSAASAAEEQFIGLPSYRVGPYAAGGVGIFGGWIDYMQLINERDGGVNGVKLTWEECETEDKIPMVTIGYGRTDAADGRVFPWVFPMITTYWSQASAIVNYMGQKEGGMDKLKGKKIGLLYHDSAYGKESHAIMDKLAAKHGFEVIKIAVAHPGNEQQSQWLQIRQAKPDYVVLWGWGVMNPTAIKAAAKTGYPREKLIGVWWSGAEEDTIPAGTAAKGFVAAGFNVAGASYPVVADIKKHVYGKDKGNMEDKSRIGSVYYNRGVVHGIIAATENIPALFAASLRHGALQKITCADHEGPGKVKFQQWDGTQWKVITDWVDSDRPLVRGMIEESAAAYAKEKGIKPRDCSKES